MRRIASLLAIVLLLGLARMGRCAGEEMRRLIPFDADWRFHLGDAKGAEEAAFSDDAWRKLDVPHDWSIEGEINLRNPSGGSQAFLPMGVGWYRKHFAMPEDATGKCVVAEFDGVMANSTVWINGQKLGERPNGYVTFRYDLTGKLKSDNVLAVRVDNAAQPASRWYAGSGITRHVRLIVTDPLHVKTDSVFITAVRDAGPDVTRLKITGVVINTGKAGRSAVVEARVSKAGLSGTIGARLPAAAIAPGEDDPFTANVGIVKPELWSPGNPAMYQLQVVVSENGMIVDDMIVPFGIRFPEFKSATGFWLNDESVKMKGVCLHIDGGGGGAAVPMGIWERRLDALKSLGVNAVRTSHNPPDPAFLELLDRKGFLVMHEVFDCWTVHKLPDDYARYFNDWWQQDLTDTVLRDRNHPSIVIYSAGNEIHDSVQKQLQLFPQIRDVYHNLDPTRPVTLAVLQADGPAGGFSNGLAALQDVVGANYRPAQLVALARAHPGMKVVETETNYGAPELPALRDDPELSGEFVWTGVDYLGESMSADGIAQGFGLLDRTGAIRARGYEHAAWWSNSPMVKIARVTGPALVNRRDVGGGRVCDWTPVNKAPHEETVEVYSNCEEVELFLNGKSLGKRSKPASVTRTWQVPFAAGTLRAVAKNKAGDPVIDELKTAGPSTQLVADADQKELTTAWDDVSVLRVNVADANGVTNPNASDEVTFSISGPGKIMAVDNADLDSHEAFRAEKRKAYHGTCIAVIKATGPGKITVKAAAAGLSDASAIINGK